MADKDKDKQKQANRERQKRYRAWKASGGVTKGVTAEGVTPTVIPEQGLIDIETLAMVDAACGDKLTHGLKPKASDPNVQAICWDKRNAQGQAAGYDDEATKQDYPQTQRPHLKR